MLLKSKSSWIIAVSLFATLVLSFSVSFFVSKSLAASTKQCSIKKNTVMETYNKKDTDEDKNKYQINKSTAAEEAKSNTINADSKSETNEKKTKDVQENSAVVEKPTDKKQGEQEKESIKPSPLPEKPQPKVAYLTFDDGPSTSTTPKVLDILAQYNIKATFFVIGKEVEQNKELLIRISREGHAIGNHSYSHDPAYLYASDSNFSADINRCDMLLKEVLPGYNSRLLRFPGGSKQRPQVFKNVALQAGYQYIDWNCLTMDAEILDVPIETQLKQIQKGAATKKELIILMHDAIHKETTVSALPQIIEYLKSKGFTFQKLYG